MTLTGKQLKEMFHDYSWQESPFDLGEFADPWDALAEKLNGMMAGEPAEPFKPPEGRVTFVDRYIVCDGKYADAFMLNVGWVRRESRRLLEKPDLEADRATHTASCPYRHGGEICKC